MEPASRDVHVLTQDDVGSVPASTGRSWLGRMADRVKRAVRPVLAGFDEHAWSGKLYLLTSALGVLTSAAGALSFAILLAVTDDVGGRTGMLPIAAVIAFTAWLQWKLLSGVARFRNWARRIAILVSGFALLGGINLIVFLPTPRLLVLGVAQVALSVQFIVYFVRERDRFLGGPDT